MATGRKRLRLEAAGFSDYLSKVDKGEIEGNYQESDLLLLADDKLKNDPVFKKYTEKDEFEFHALIFDGEQTGYARCTDETCRRRLKDREGKIVFQCQQYNRDGMLKKYVIRHLSTYHLSDAEEIIKRNESRQKRILSQQSDSSQPSISMFTTSSKKKIDAKAVSGLQQRNAAVIAEKGLSLDFFVNDVVLERDRFLLEKLGYDPDEVFRFNRGKTAVKNDLFKTCNENNKKIAKVAHSLADTHRLAWLIDHQSLPNLPNEPADDALGSALILTADDGHRYPYLLAFDGVRNKTNDETVRMVRQTAKETHAHKID